MFYAIYMPAGGGWKSFPTRDEAYAWIEGRRCPSCVEHARKCPFQNCDGCTAEWDVWTEQEALEFGPLLASDEIKATPRRMRRLELTVFGLTFVLWQAAGLLSVYRKDWCLHLLVRPRFWCWGIDREWELFIGLGPLFLFVAEW